MHILRRITAFKETTFLDLKEKRAYLNVAFDDTFNQKSDMASLIATTQLSEFHAI